MSCSKRARGRCVCTHQKWLPEKHVHDQPSFIAAAAARRKAPAERRSSTERQVDTCACAAGTRIGMPQSWEAHCGLMVRRYGATGHQKKLGQRATGRHWQQQRQQRTWARSALCTGCSRLGKFAKVPVCEMLRSGVQAFEMARCPQNPSHPFFLRDDVSNSLRPVSRPGPWCHTL